MTSAARAKSAARRAPLRIERGPGRRFTVVSARDGETARRYCVDADALSCDCPAGIRDRRCRHLAAVLDMLHADAVPPKLG